MKNIKVQDRKCTHQTGRFRFFFPCRVFSKGYIWCWFRHMKSFLFAGGSINFLSSAGQFQNEKKRKDGKMQRGTPPRRFPYHQSQLPPALQAFHRFPPAVLGNFGHGWVADQPILLATSITGTATADVKSYSWCLFGYSEEQGQGTFAAVN
jgi:hypothetical protein